jgi:hypothetical protein
LGWGSGLGAQLRVGEVGHVRQVRRFTPDVNRLSFLRRPEGVHLMKFVDEDTFDIESFRRAVRLRVRSS